MGSLRRRLMIVSCGAIAVLAAARYYVRPVLVVGESMSPSLRHGQVVWMRSIHRGDPRPRPGEIIVFRHRGVTAIKRVYCVGGERVRMVRFWNDPQHTEPLGGGIYALRVRQLASQCPEKVRISTVSLPPDTVYLVGDNITCSVDSRDFGPIPLNEVWGRVLLPEKPAPARYARAS